MIDNISKRHYKEIPPEDTIFKIYSALHKCRIKTFYTPNPEIVKGCCSNRVEIEGTSLGTNGKGVNKTFALASGYAELAERLQNNMIYTGVHNPKLFKERGFYYAPDEKFISKDNLINSDDAFMSFFYKSLGCNNYFDKIRLINNAVDRLQKNLGISENDKILMIPFYSVKSKKLVYLPYAVYYKIYGSNGMSAGNTIEEAMVQGLSEIYERYVNRKILENNVTPPTVPQEIIDKSRMKDVVREVTKSGRYNVIVKDLSLGKGYPVLGTIISDRKTGRFGFRLGSHPSFEIALERTLTEAFQGRSLENFVSTASIGTDSQSASDSNIYNIFRNGEGTYHCGLFGKEPDYEYTPFADVVEMTNKELMNKMISPILESGYDIFVRDSSYLGFPAIQIIVPDMNEINKPDLINLKLYNTQANISIELTEGKIWSDNIKNRVMHYVKYMLYKNRINDCTLQRIFSRPFNNILIDSGIDIPLILSLICYSMKNYDEALNMLKSISLDSLKSDNKTLIQCIKLYITQISDGKMHNTVSDLVYEVYDDATADKVCNWLCEPEKTMDKVFSFPPCWHCEECIYAKDGRCNYPNIYDLFYKLGKEMEKNFPNQLDLADIL